MHPAAMKHGLLFFQTYLDRDASCEIIDIGAQDINGSLKAICPPGCRYIGVDYAHAKGVDIVLDDPYQLPFADESADVVVSSSCLEHSEMFWLSFLEMLRILKPTGLLYINVPSNGSFHRFPVDCWRFYPDSGNALVTWAKRCGYTPLLLESFSAKKGNTGNPEEDEWNDYVAVFLKDDSQLSAHPNRILHSYADFENGYLHGVAGFINPQSRPESVRGYFELNKK